MAVYKQPGPPKLHHKLSLVHLTHHPVMYEGALFPPDSELDLSFTSCASTTATTRTFTSSSPRSSLTLSFNENRLSTTSTTTSTTTTTHEHRRPHRKSDPHWSAIKAATNLSSDGTLHLRHLKLLRLLGTGNCGRVFLCRLRDNDHANFALKVVDRESLTDKKLSHVQTEAQILSSLDHPFLPTLCAHIDASHYTCLLIDYCPNGDLHSLLHKQPGYRLSVESVRFYAAEVLGALEYLHSLGVVYRDLKPENVLLREDGHIMLSDFDLCFKADVVPKLENRTHHHKVGSTKKRWRQRHRKPDEVVTEFTAEPTTAFSRSCVGTHEYLAPEVVTGNGHGNGVDWWAFGVLIYELLYGRTPFKGESKEATLRNIASTRGVRLHARGRGEEEVGMAEAMDLIERLLVNDPSKRLGCVGGATEIKRHPFFNGIKWPLIRNYRPPLVARKDKAHVNGVTSPKRRRCWWKRLACIMMKNKGSIHHLNSNSNYYSSYSSSNKVKKCA